MSNSVLENYNENYMNRFSCSGFPTNSRGRCSLRRRFEIYWYRCTVIFAKQKCWLQAFKV